MPFGISVWELLILLVVLLLVFGAKRLPEMGRSLGKGMREFKEGVTGVEDTVRTPTASPSAELPASQPEPDTPADASESEPERETVR